VAGLENVRVEGYSGLTVDLARRLGADVLLRGLRSSADLHFEAEIAYTNRRVTGIETVFVLPSPDNAFISSRLIRQIAAEGGDVSGLVPPEVLPHLRSKPDRRG
jgi:pantetheine-phosphate adenylyltransferase